MPRGATPPLPLRGRETPSREPRKDSFAGGPPLPLARERGPTQQRFPSGTPRTPEPGPQSQSFSRGYGSGLPTFLTSVLLSARGCSPRRPAAVIGTTERNSDPLPRVFKVQRGRPGRPGSRDALPGAQPYLRANRFQGHARPSRRRENPPQDPRWRPRVRSRCRQPPAARFGDLDPIPFRGRRGLGTQRKKEDSPPLGSRAPSAAGFPRPLGSTDPRPTAVRAEPFSASAFRVLV